MDIIITDHHMPPDDLPKACAVVNVHQAGDQYDYKELAGAGVAFKLCQALYQKLENTTAYWEKYYREREYVEGDLAYVHYEPAYRYGWESRARYDHDDFAKVETELEKNWKKYRADSCLEWGAARPAAEDAWNRVNREYESKK